jgi:hypothetical protein
MVRPLHLFKWRGGVTAEHDDASKARITMKDGTIGQGLARRIGMVSGPMIPLLLLTAALAHGQIQIGTPPPTAEPRLRVIEPPLGHDVTRIPEADAYSRFPSVPYDPAFIEPFTKDFETPTSTGRMGISGWTAPNVPVGASGTGYREINGWAGLGWSVTWGGPPPASAAASPAIADDESGPRRPIRVGELVRRTTDVAGTPGRVVTVFQRNGTSFAEVDWLGTPSSQPTAERLDRLRHASPGH